MYTFKLAIIGMIPLPTHRLVAYIDVYMAHVNSEVRWPFYPLHINIHFFPYIYILYYTIYIVHVHPHIPMYIPTYTHIPGSFYHIPMISCSTSHGSHRSRYEENARRATSAALLDVPVATRANRGSLGSLQTRSETI